MIKCLAVRPATPSITIQSVPQMTRSLIIAAVAAAIRKVSLLLGYFFHFILFIFSCRLKKITKDFNQFKAHIVLLRFKRILKIFHYVKQLTLIKIHFVKKNRIKHLHTHKHI